MSKRFGEKLEAAMGAKGFTQKSFAAHLGTNQPQISRWVGGENPPKPEYLLRIARALDVSVDYLIDPEIEHLRVESDLAKEAERIAKRLGYELAIRRMLNLPDEEQSTDPVAADPRPNPAEPGIRINGDYAPPPPPPEESTGKGKRSRRAN